MQIPLFLFYFQVPTILLMCTDFLDPKNAEKSKKYNLKIFEFLAKTKNCFLSI